MRGLSERIAVVTGAASGIGAAVVVRLKSEGVRVAGVDLHESPGADLSLCADVGDPAAMVEAIAEVAAKVGAPTLGVHAAGITRDRALWKLDPDDWDDVMRINLKGAFNLTRALVPHLRAPNLQAQGPGGASVGGSLVFVGSINGGRGKFGQAAYASSKAGMMGFAKTAAKELGRFGGRVNVVAPGMVRTPMTEGLESRFFQKAIDETVLGRVAEPEEIASVIAFLLSEEARHVTGQILNVDGGQAM